MTKIVFPNRSMRSKARAPHGSLLNARTERNTGQRPGVTTDEQQRVKALEREVRELRRTNEILRKASAYFAQAELDRREPR